MNYNISRATRRLALAVSRMAPLPQLAHSAPEWSAAMQPKIDAAVTTTLKGTGVPAASDRCRQPHCIFEVIWFRSALAGTRGRQFHEIEQYLLSPH
jgi:hypothetical protein